MIIDKPAGRLPLASGRRIEGTARMWTIGMQPLPAGCFVAACVIGLACNADDTPSPTSPSPATASTVTVTYPADHRTIYIGDRVQFSATVSSGGGLGQAADNAAWESNAPAVATVSSSGLVTAVSAGEATISADVDPSGRGSLRIRVFPEFDGQWVGYFNITRATFPPDWQQLPDSEDCEGLSDCDGYYPFRAVFTQEEETVTGSLMWFEPPDLEIPEWTWTVQDGSVSIDGTLSLTFDEVAFPAILSEVPFEIRHRLMSWESRADTPGLLTGAAQMHLTADELSDTVVADGCLGSERLQCSGWRRDGQ